MIGHPRGIWNFLRDPKTPRSARVVAVLALLYVLSPIDAVPELVAPLVGWLDDLGAAGFALAWLASKAAAHESAQRPRDDAAIGVEPVTPPAAPPSSAGP